MIYSLSADDMPLLSQWIKKTILRRNTIKLRNEPSSEKSPVLFFEKILQKDLTNT